MSLESKYGGTIPMTLDASAQVGDLIAAPGTTGYPLRALGLQTINGNSTYKRVDSAQLIGGRIAQVYANASGSYPAFRILDAGGKEVVSETVITSARLVGHDIRVTALADGDFFVFWLDSNYLPHYAIYDPTGAVVKAWTQLEATGWVGGGISHTAKKPAQLSGGNIIIIGVNNSTGCVRACEINAAGTVVTGPSDIGTDAPSTNNHHLTDPVGASSNNRWAYSWVTSGAAQYARVLTAGLANVASYGGDASIDDVCIAADASGNIWQAFIRVGASPTVTAYCYVAAGAWIAGAIEFSSTSVNVDGYIRGACTSAGVFVVACPSSASVPGVAIGVAEIDPVGGASIIKRQHMTLVLAPIGEGWPYHGAAVVPSSISGEYEQAIVTAANGDVVICNAYYFSAWNRIAEDAMLHFVRVAQDGRLAANKTYQPGAHAVGSSALYRYALTATKSHLILGLNGRGIARMLFMPGAPVIGAMSATNRITQSGKHTGGGGFPQGHTLSEQFSLFEHLSDAAFLSSTDYVLKG